MPGAPFELHGERQQELGVAPAAAAAAHGDRGLAAGEQHAGRPRPAGRGGAPRARSPAMHLGDLARLALDRIAEDERRAGRARGRLRPRPRARSAAGATMIVSAPGEARVAGLRRLVARRRAGARATAGRRHRCGSARGWRARRRRCVGSGTVGPEPITAGSSPGTSEIRRLTTSRRMGRGGEPPALDRREMLAHGVHLADVGAGGEQRPVDRLLVVERQARRPAARAAPRRRPRSGRAPDRPAPAPAASARMRAAASRPRRPAPDAPPRRSRSRAGHAMAVAGHHQPFERARPVVLDRLRHGGRGLAGAEDDRPPARRRGQVGQDRARGRRDLDRGIEQLAQTRLAFDHPLWRTHGSGPATAAADPG